VFTTSPAAIPSPSAGRAPSRYERLACRHRDPNLEVVLFPGPVADRECCTNGPLRIVFVRDRCTEERHHSVSYELLDRAAVPLELAAQTLPVRAEHGAHVLRIEPLRARGKADEVGEEHGDDLALLAPRLSGQRRAAS
jgi:hypothetical protein